MKPQSNLNEEKRMMDYLQGNMSEAEKQAYEAEQMQDDFTSDAVEGLSGLSAESIFGFQQDLNMKLQQQLHRKKRKKRKNGFTNPFYFYISLFLIILLAIIGYWVIKKMNP